MSEQSDTALNKISSHDAAIAQLHEKYEELRMNQRLEQFLQASPTTASFLEREKNTNESQGEIYKNYHTYNADYHVYENN